MKNRCGYRALDGRERCLVESDSLVERVSVVGLSVFRLLKRDTTYTSLEACEEFSCVGPVFALLLMFPHNSHTKQ